MSPSLFLSRGLMVAPGSRSQFFARDKGASKKDKMNPNLYRSILLAAMFAMSAAGCVRSAEGASLDAETDSGVSGEIRLVSMQSRDKGARADVFSRELYLEMALADGLSAFVIAYHDKAFESASLGIAGQLGDLQAGIGAGKARYDGSSHLVVNPWLYYQSGKYTGLLTADHYGNEAVTPWFYHGYIERNLDDRYLAGVYGEKAIGAGPMMGMYLGGLARIWVSVPVVSRPSQGGMRSLLGLTFAF